MRTRLVVSIIKTTTSIRGNPSVAARISRVIRALGTRLQFSTCARGVRAAVFGGFDPPAPDIRICAGTSPIYLCRDCPSIYMTHARLLWS